MSNLRTNYKDDVFTGKRKYSEIDNGDGTISFDDVTDYAQVGDSYGAAQINETNDVINNLDSKAYKSTDGVESGLADNDYFPFFDTSANASKKTLWSNIKSILSNVFAPKSHVSSEGIYGTASATLFGHVKLSDNYEQSAGGAASAIGASSKAVNDSYNANKSSITSLSGEVAANKSTETQHFNSLTNLINGKAPILHKSENRTYGVGTGTEFGHLKIKDTYSGDDTAASGIAASGKAVSDVYTSLSNSKAPTNHASTDTTYGKGSYYQYGHLKISDNLNMGSAADGVAASSKVVGDVSARELSHYSTINGELSEINGDITEIKGELTANGNRIYMDYQNGKYGYNTSANRGADTFHPFSGLVSANSFSISFDTSGSGGYSSGQVYFPLWVLKDLKLTLITGTLQAGGLSLTNEGSGVKQITLPYTLTDSDFNTYTKLTARGSGNTSSGGSAVLTAVLIFSQP